MCHWPKCYRVLNWFFLPKPGFLEFIFEFSAVEITEKSTSPTFWIQILSNKFHSILRIKIFPSTPNAHFKSSEIFSYLIFSEEIIQYSRTFAPQVQTLCNQAHAPLLVESFPKTPRTSSKASDSMDLITTRQNKTNYLPS